MKYVLVSLAKAGSGRAGGCRTAVDAPVTSAERAGLARTAIFIVKTRPRRIAGAFTR